MQLQRWSSLIGLVMLAAVGRTALADPPATWEVTYGIHETLTDPASLIVFQVTLALSRVSQSGHSIGWDVASIEIERASTGDVWTEANPYVPTQGGLWWISHADANNPQMAEFVRPPLLTGTATAQNPNTADLAYSVEGQLYAEPLPPAQPPYTITGALDYSFRLVSEQTPILAGSGEPVEVDPPIKI